MDIGENLTKNRLKMLIKFMKSELVACLFANLIFIIANENKKNLLPLFWRVKMRQKAIFPSSPAKVWRRFYSCFSEKDSSFKIRPQNGSLVAKLRTAYLSILSIINISPNFW
jgi:hypothetical protein